MSVFTVLKSVVRRLPFIKAVVAERDALREGYRFVPPGHYYSPIPPLEEIRRDEAKIFADPGRTLPGLDLREEAQRALLEDFVPYYREMPFQPHQTEGLRYYFENPAYAYSDAILLYCMIRHLSPARIVEVGSGFSSCVMLDTRERFFDDAIHLTFIDPYPERLEALLHEQDRERVRILPQRLQDVPLEVFATLQAGDILFVDSTHVSKINSDVNRIFFEILPALAPGVYIHFHDVFYPFEYPRAWIYEGRAWNELYLLRAFLQYNSQFRIVLMNTFMERYHASFFREKMPLCLVNPGGSLWICKAPP